jgi:hypothetical protein
LCKVDKDTSNLHLHFDMAVVATVGMQRQAASPAAEGISYDDC